MKEIKKLTIYLKRNGLSLAKSCLTKQFWRLPEEPDRLLVVFLDDLALSGSDDHWREDTVKVFCLSVGAFPMRAALTMDLL